MPNHDSADNAIDPASCPQHQRCYLCGSEDLADKFAFDGYDIARCCGCSFVFVKQRLTPAQLADYYQTSGPSDPYVDQGNLANLSYYYERVKRLIEARVPSGRVLDVGCSQGQFLRLMEGWERYGVELETVSARMAQESFGDNIKIASLEEAGFSPGFFDVITLQDVLDHLPDPLGSLELCHKLLRPGGMIIVKVHNISCLYARLTGPRFYAVIPPAHLSYFDRKTLAYALERSGFSILSSHFIAHKLFLKTVFLRLSKSPDGNGLFNLLYNLTKNSPLGDIRIHKNLRDIITMVALKK